MNVKKYDVIVGIDPDANESGVAIYNKKTKKLTKESLSFPEMMDKLDELFYLKHKLDILIVVEAGWLIKKSNFHGKQGGRAERIAKNVGSNHQVGKNIIEMCLRYGFDVKEQKPFKKTWKGKNRKITHEEINYILKSNGLEEFKRTNQEVRDAILICINHAGLVIRVKV